MKLILPVLALLAFTAPAIAAPVKWALDGVTFSDGGEGSGYFVFDRDPNAIDGDYLEIAIATTAGTDAPGRNYSGIDDLRSSPYQLLALDNADAAQAQWALLLVFDAPLNDAGGVRSLVSIQEAMCGTPTCIPASQIARSVDNSLATISAVPIPAAFWLFGSTFGVLGWFRRKPAGIE